MKKLFSVLMLTLAINFLLVAGGAGYLFKQGKLSRDNVQAIGKIIFPPPAAQPTDNPSNAPATTQPTIKLADLVARAAGRPATEQLELLQTTFDEKMAELDRSKSDLERLEAQVISGQNKLAMDRAALTLEQKKLAGQEATARKQVEDKGFQDSLEVYNAMAPSQVKKVFMSLDEPTVVKYLQAMEPRKAAAILKEFKSADEVEKVHHVIEMMRVAQTDAKE